MSPILDRFASARSSHEVVAATAHFLAQDVRESPELMQQLHSVRLETLDDVERCIDRLQDAVKDSASFVMDEERIDRVLSYLLVASIRARQLT